MTRLMWFGHRPVRAEYRLTGLAADVYSCRRCGDLLEVHTKRLQYPVPRSH